MALMTLGVTPPAPDADERTRLVFIRGLCVRVLAISAPVVVLILLIGGRGVAATVVLLGFAAQVINVVWLWLKIRRL